MMPKFGSLSDEKLVEVADAANRALLALHKWTGGEGKPPELAPGQVDVVLQAAERVLGKVEDDDDE